MEESDRNSFGSTVCHLTKKAKTLNALLCFAYRLSLPKSPPQSYRSYSEFAALPRPRQFLPVTCLVYLRCTCPSDARALSCQHPTVQFLVNLRVVDDPSRTMMISAKRNVQP